jgi:hypothetical protein
MIAEGKIAKAKIALKTEIAFKSKDHANYPGLPRKTIRRDPKLPGFEDPGEVQKRETRGAWIRSSGIPASVDRLFLVWGSMADSLGTARERENNAGRCSGSEMA